jgi:glycosyltransferase involved in cell wall biosynthesis
VTRLRVLLLADFYPPIIGGLEGHVRSLAGGLVERGHDVAVATQRVEGTPDLEVDENGATVHRIGGLAQALSPLHQRGDRRFHPPFPDPVATRELRRVVREHRPDVVHAHSWIAYSFLPIKRSSGATLLWTLHDYGLICARQSFINKGRPCSGPNLPKCISCSREQYGAPKGAVISTGMRGARPLLPRVDRFLAVSSAVAKVCDHVGLGDRVEVVTNFLANDAADEGLREPRPAFLPDGDFLLFVGELSPHKGTDVLLEAHARLGDAAPPLVMIGARHPSRPQITSDRVVLAQDVPHAQVMRAWAEAGIGVVPSVFPDPCPTTAIEAMTTGTPLVGSRVGGLPEIVADGETGLLGRAGDAGELEANLRRLIGDPALRARMREASLERAERFRASSVIPRIERAYHATLGHVPEPRPLEVAAR